jgi:3-isopropylmalate/(R)-2-methylmalate dehydratase small subunit
VGRLCEVKVMETKIGTKIYQGKAHTFGDSINTDVISPGRWMREGLEVLKLHTMEAVRKDFYKDVTPGDIIVAGRNFGCGSHREPANSVMKVLGISAIVADSVARLYFRNGIAMGIPVFSAPGVSKIVNEGDEVQVKVTEEAVEVTNITTGAKVFGKPIPDVMRSVVEAGGILALLKAELEREKQTSL